MTRPIRRTTARAALGNGRRLQRPRFLWQGLLIILPAIVLAGTGIWALRQDRILAIHEAAETAKKIVTDLARERLPGALMGDLPSSENLPIEPNVLGRPEDDPLYRAARRSQPRSFCVLSAEAQLLYPPPIGSLMPPDPLDRAQLTRDQAKSWRSAEHFMFADQNWRRAADALSEFIDLEPPTPFVAAAHYRHAVASRNTQQELAALSEFQLVADQFPTAISESGLPLKILASLQALRLARSEVPSPVEKPALIDTIAQSAIYSPTPLSSFCMDKMAEWAEDSRLSTKWARVWQAHQAARGLYTMYLDTLDRDEMGTDPKFHAAWLLLTPDKSWFALAHKIAHQWWLIALPEATARQIVTHVLASQTMPSYLGVRVDLAGKRLVGSPSVSEVLASTASNSTDPAASIAVSAYLANPSAFFQRQRVRTLWFGALIALSAGAVLVGYWAARSAFFRQQMLSEMKTNFVSSVSHELRAPIASVRLMAEELEDAGPADPPKTSQYHRFIVQECRRLSALIENVLDFARHEQGRKEYEFEPTDVTALVQETTNLMRVYSLEKQVELQVAVPGEPLEMEVDGRAMQQVLINLIDNAVKHSPPGSTVKVGLDFAPEPDSKPPNNGRVRCVHLWVEDVGEGIPPEDHERIFERFYRRGSELRRETQGVGLGLAIVKYVAEAHHGRVLVRSGVGQGSRFTVELPLSTPTV